MENVKQLLRDYDPATRTIAKALLALSTEPIQVSTQESDEAFDIMARREMDGLDTGLTQTEARQLNKLKWYKGKTRHEIVSFQLFQSRVCMPFRKYLKAVETVLGRPVQIREFKDIPLLQEECRRQRARPTSPQRTKSNKQKSTRRSGAR